MSEWEWVAVVLGLLNVALVVARSVWNYPFGLAMVCIYALIFYETRLYSDALLQLFFFVVQIYGWIAWRAASAAAQVPVRWMAPKSRALWAAGIVAAWLVWSAGMARFTDAAAPWVDGAIAMMSVAAQILMARRMVENWWLWIGVDLLAIPLFASRGLVLTAGLYALFLLMSLVGLIQWRRAAADGKAAA
ncbi:nicotinamide mononucleotide transporter [Sphingopyxis sp. QXT-31]|uniref:nicotinamide riboside transporter PnuC n=1 Tax=Sphingopyxis sp. QXT-31 TaxID=1357916 RepID=UPI000979844E|nr:nicotinamide riboside transporter PnuC [Sphingopyxis sp. QXT-31]AQA01009.1 nicotinamide mononucleotide transporter [Sphingopyxis sp. QXT-31]